MIRIVESSVFVKAFDLELAEIWEAMTFYKLGRCDN